jgi:hypothetical protein
VFQLQRSENCEGDKQNKTNSTMSTVSVLWVLGIAVGLLICIMYWVDRIEARLLAIESKLLQVPSAELLREMSDLTYPGAVAPSNAPSARHS